ncbi:hypothetical protein [Shimia thalassica]|uniref:hypothetical protein n=1 Tax=Shimia thalassica TaxID=1715693 RepID=UPI0026E346FB|nr:hypothetical protein [Shimia thalassica]MDO6483100.1 hypothetical protein [Shimia thalassica]
MTKMPKMKAEKRDELLEICKKSSGEYLPSHHGKGSWATTYSRQFISAATDLWLLYKEAGSNWPVADLSRDFRRKNIRSCRGADMSFARVEYLLKSHIGAEIERREL